MPGYSIEDEFKNVIDHRSAEKYRLSPRIHIRYNTDYFVLPPKPQGYDGKCDL